MGVCTVYIFSILSDAVQNEDSTNRAEIFTEASTIPVHQVNLGELDPIRIQAAPIRSSTTLLILNNPLMTFNVFFGQMYTEYDVDYVQTVLNIVRFSDLRNRSSNWDRLSTDDFRIFFRQVGSTE